MRAASYFCVALAAVDAFSPPRPTRPLSPQQRRRSVVVAGGSILPPKLREYGTYGLVAYGFVELAWWGALGSYFDPQLFLWSPPPLRDAHAGRPSLLPPTANRSEPWLSSGGQPQLQLFVDLVMQENYCNTLACQGTEITTQLGVGWNPHMDRDARVGMWQEPIVNSAGTWLTGGPAASCPGGPAASSWPPGPVFEFVFELLWFVLSC